MSILSKEMTDKMTKEQKSAALAATGLLQVLVSTGYLYLFVLAYQYAIERGYSMWWSIGAFALMTAFHRMSMMVSILNPTK